MSDIFNDAEAAAQFVLSQTSLRPRVGLVLGSGLGAFADSLSDAVQIPYASIPKFPQSTAIGHAGRLVVGKVGEAAVAVMQGRVHLYEGYSAQQVAFPMRVLGRMGIRHVVLTNAAGGVDVKYQRGALVLICDHVNLQGQNPLVGLNDERFGKRFPDMSYAYAKEYREMARAEAVRLGIELHEGVYAGLLGPSYETPAEIKYLRTIGADLVGMSTVAEAIAAGHMKIGVLGISCVTNMAAGILDQPLSEEEVIETGERVRPTLEALLGAVIPRMVGAGG